MTTVEHLQSVIAEELGLWINEIPTLTNGYDYENTFIKRVQKINNLLLEASIDNTCSQRDKKK